MNLQVYVGFASKLCSNMPQFAMLDAVVMFTMELFLSACMPLSQLCAATKHRHCSLQQCAGIEHVRRLAAPAAAWQLCLLLHSLNTSQTLYVLSILIVCGKVDRRHRLTLCKEWCCRFPRFIFAWLPKLGVQPKTKQFGMVIKVWHDTVEA